MPEPGWAELDVFTVLEKIKKIIKTAASQSGADPVTALSVSSLGEAVVPVTKQREALGNSMLNFDVRGDEYVNSLSAELDDQRLYQINGNTFGNHYSLTKIKWIKEHQPDIYEKTYKFLHWSSFVAFILGAEPVLDYSLANRSLLFDVNKTSWSDDLISQAGLDRIKLPELAPSGTVIGTISKNMADELGLPSNVSIVAGAHDQCANALGCGVISDGQAVYGMGTYICITPVFGSRREPSFMIERGLNTEHHAVPDKFVCFLYNHGGVLLKWFRDTFAAVERDHARAEGKGIYSQLLEEMPAEPTGIVALPHFAPTGPPEFVTDTCGVFAGLHLDTSRGDILKGILEGSAFYFKESVDTLPDIEIEINDFRVVGGGSKSDAWIQICADIFGRPFVRPVFTEAGTLGAAIMAGVGVGMFSDFESGVINMVTLDRTFEPNAQRHAIYQERFKNYRRLYPLAKEYLSELHRSAHIK